jgi:cytoplasmic tRNA 2-thiolation protein 2
LDLSSTNPDDIDWSSLPFRSPFSQRQQGSSDSEPSPPQPSVDETEKTLQTLLASLPSAASRADIVRLLTRHALVSQAHQHGCQALLLGHSTTALAELTLAEAAKGRGFSLPWLVRDGPSPTDDDEDDDDFSSSIPDDHTATASVNHTSNHAGGGKDRGRRRRLLIYHPLRELQRRELATYASLTEPALTPLLGLASPSLDNSNSSNNRIVSHKDLSIEEVMARYFGEVEAEYPSVIANVVRTAGKLVPREVTEHEGDNNDDDEDDYEDAGETAGGEGSKKKRREGRCGLCRMPLDLAGDERWRGELGEKKEISLQGRKGRSRLCYGCERSTAG